MEKKDIWVVLMGAGLVAGYTYSVDWPQALEVPLREQPYSLNTDQFNWLYIATFLPICFFDIPLGMAMDRFSITHTLGLSIVLSFLSQLMIALMFMCRPNGYFYVILVLRSLFGVTGEGNFTGQGIIIAKYSKNNYQYILSYCIGIGFLFNSFNSIATTSIYDQTHDLPFVQFIGASVCFFSGLCGFALLWIVQKKVKKQLLMENLEDEEQGEKQKVPKSIFQQLKSLNSTFWFLMLLAFMMEASLPPFVDNLNDLLVKRFNFQYATAGKLLLIPYGLLAILSVGLGKMMQNYSKYRRLLVLASSLVYFTFMIILYLLPNTSSPSPIYYILVAMFLCSMSMGLATFYSILCPSIAYVVDQDCLGTAWGVVGTMYGLAEFLVPFINSWAIDQGSTLAEGYTNLSFLAIFLCFLPSFFQLRLYFGPYQIIDQTLQKIQEKRAKGYETQYLIKYYYEQSLKK